MLPQSRAVSVQVPSPAKFADTAVPALLDAVIGGGARRSSLEAVLCGGASMFGTAARPIGEDNIAAVDEAQAALGIRIVAREVGGTHARTCEVYPAQAACRCARWEACRQLRLAA